MAFVKLHYTHVKTLIATLEELGELDSNESDALRQLKLMALAMENAKAHRSQATENVENQKEITK